MKTFIALCVGIALLSGGVLNAQQVEPFSDITTAPPVDLPPVAGDVVFLPQDSPSAEWHSLPSVFPPAQWQPPATHAFTMEQPDGTTVLMSVPAYSAGFAGYSPGTDSASLLHNRSVVKDLEIVDDQKAEIKEMRKRHRQEVQDLFTLAHNPQPDGKNSQASFDINKRMSELQRQQREELENVLLPHQRERIKQIGRQMQLEQMGVANSFQHGMLAKDLEITKDQKKQLAKLQREMHQEMQKQMEAIKEATKKKMMAELSAGQREKLKSLVGDKFKPQQASSFSHLPPPTQLSPPTPADDER